MSNCKMPNWNGVYLKELCYDDIAFLCCMRNWQVARIVDGRVQIRNPSDTGYAISYNDAVKRAAEHGWEF